MIRKEERSSKVIAITSIKGGVGKTTTTANFGGVVAKHFGKRVLVLDANLSAPNLGLHFGYVDADVTVHDVLDKKNKYSEAIYDYGDGLYVMPGLLKGKFFNKWSFGEIISDVRKEYDIIFIDTSPSVNELDKVLKYVDEVVFVATPDYPTLSTTLQIAEYIGGEVSVAGIILNMVKNKKFELKKTEIEFATDVKVIGTVPYNLALPESVTNVSPLGIRYPNHKISRKYVEIAKVLLNEDTVKEKKDFWKGVKYFWRVKR
jgi:flagellar biosynthesis protein FlhG